MPLHLARTVLSNRRRGQTRPLTDPAEAGIQLVNETQLPEWKPLEWRQGNSASQHETSAPRAGLGLVASLSPPPPTARQPLFMSGLAQMSPCL